MENIPAYLGGKCECEGGCVPGSPNGVIDKQKVPTPEEIEKLAQIIKENKKTDEKAIALITNTKK